MMVCSCHVYSMTLMHTIMYIEVLDRRFCREDFI